jgi:hypothetical protein
MQHQGEIAREERIDRYLGDVNTFLSLLEGLTEGIIVCEPLKGAVKVAKEIINMLQVSRRYLFSEVVAHKDGHVRKPGRTRRTAKSLLTIHVR